VLSALCAPPGTVALKFRHTFALSLALRSIDLSSENDPTVLHAACTFWEAIAQLPSVRAAWLEDSAVLEHVSNSLYMIFASSLDQTLVATACQALYATLFGAGRQLCLGLIERALIETILDRVQDFLSCDQVLQCCCNLLEYAARNYSPGELRSHQRSLLALIDALLLVIRPVLKSDSFFSPASVDSMLAAAGAVLPCAVRLIDVGYSIPRNLLDELLFVCSRAGHRSGFSETEAKDFRQRVSNITFQ